MRTFLSPAEQRLLASLPMREEEIVRAVMNELDAHLVEDVEDSGQSVLFVPLADAA